MNRVFYNKLIRDKIPQKILNNKGKYKTRVISDDQEFEQELLKKVLEEASAVSRARTGGDLVEELADLVAVIQALQKHEKITDKELKEAVSRNFAKKGGFSKRLFLHWSSDTGYKSNESPQGTRIKKRG
ncbi:MAG: hypothetical protein A3D52_01670 [Candidatus Taylorbacteria bacterium RIFCSPHIGHO2_02_FULL_44_36]|nr:MAG: hypothetical protein A3D52_01670 [Candidatus Taylorbacteria bacterium RIFCSPHIGHO2_02_FULL_44_36]HXK41087.1 nucleoside triphosphate pyrophosphohydrolase [Candidatus Paceibacterota bacterium]